MKNKTYWNNNGKYQELYGKLGKLIPTMGDVADAKNNPALERLRVAANCYYDLFNNGLCNRAAEFRKVFGFAGAWIAKSKFPYHEPLEMRMDEFILAADKEQVYNNPKCRAGEDLYEALKYTNTELPFIRDKSGFTEGSMAVQVINSIIAKNAEVLAKAKGK